MGRGKAAYWLAAAVVFAFIFAKPRMLCRGISRPTRSLEPSKPRATQGITRRQDRERTAGAKRAAAASSEPGATRNAIFAGTEVDGELVAGADDQLLLTLGVRQQFDYFLLATGQEDDHAIETRVYAAIDRSLPGRAAVQARDLWRRYRLFREAIADLATPADLADFAAVMAAVIKLQEEYFTAPERDAFFAEDNVENERALLLREIMADPLLTPAERQAEIDALEKSRSRKARLQRAASLAAVSKTVAEP